MATVKRSRKKTAAIKRDIARETAILESQAEAHSGVPALDALLSADFTTMTDKEALEVALAAQQYLRGDGASLLGQVAQGVTTALEQLNKLNERMDRYDQAAAAWTEDREKFIEDVFNRAERLKVPEMEREKMQGRVAVDLQKKIQEARAEIVVDKQQFEQQIKAMPRVRVAVAGDVQIARGKPVILPEVVSIKHMRWVLQPGKIYEVPEIVARELERRQRDREQNEKLKGLLDAGPNAKLRRDTELAPAIEALNREYGDTSEPFPIASQ
jgi:hypothetical protein